jgi:putative PEP-CTERM system TPR-repeat lipoprotein
MNKLLINSAVVLALTLSACSEQKTAEQLMASADQFSQQGKYANAIIDYKNAVRLVPKSAEARLRLGQAYLNQGNYISAEKELDRAVDLEASYTQAATLLAQVKTRLDKHKEVEHLVGLSEELNDKDYLTILSYAGMATLANGEVAKAQDYFSQAIAILAENPYNKLSQGYLSYINRDFLQGIEITKSLLKEQEPFAEASLLQGFLYFSLNNYEYASDSFEQYLDSYPLDQTIRFFLVNSLIKAGKFEQANILTDELLVTFKESPLALQYKSQIEYNAGNYVEAQRYATQAVNYDDSFVIANMIAGISSYQLDELEQAYDYLISLEGMLPATHPINTILLSIKIKLGHTDDIAVSVDKLKELKNSDSNADLLQISSLELLEAGDLANAQSLLNKATQISPNNANLQIRQGALLLSQKDLSGVKSLENALSIDASLHDTEFALARQYLRSNEVSKAEVIANKWLKSENHKASGNILNGLIAMKREKVDEAEKSFQNALAFEPKSISAIYNLAIVAAFNKEVVKAIDGFKEVIELNPNHHNAIRRYTILQTRQGNSANAISFLNALYEENRLNKKVYKNLVIGLAQNLRINKQVTAAIELLESIKVENNLSVRYWSVLASSYTQIRKYNQALSTYELALKEVPRSYILYVGKIATLEVLQQYPQALALTKVANDYFPNDNNLMTTLAYLELANNNVQAAKRQLKVLKDKGVTNHLMTATAAKIAIKESDFSEAVELYSELYEKIPNANNAINLARALQFSKQGGEAELVLENYLAKEVNDNRVRMLLAGLYSMNNVNNSKSAQIISTYQTIVDRQPDNLAALNNLAWQQYQSNFIKSAQQNIEKALALSPNNTSILESYGVILVTNKRYKKAIEVLSSVVSRGSTDISAKVSLVEAYVAVNQYEQAKMILSGLSSHDSKLNVKIAKLKQEVAQY